MRATETGLVTAADGWQDAGFGNGEGDQLLDDPEDYFGACGDVELLEKAVEVRVRGVLVHAEAAGDLFLREVVEDALNNLQLTRGDAQRRGDFGPGVVAEDCCAAQFLVLGAFWFRSHGARLTDQPREQKGRELNTPRQRHREAPSQQACQAAPEWARLRLVAVRPGKFAVF